jgi:hypothetical protein
MAQRTWIGGATAVAQVWKTTVASATSSDTYEIILANEVGGSLTLTYTAGGGDTVTTIAAGLVALIAASSDPRALAVTAVNLAGLITVTADAPGTPFYATTGGTGTFSGTGNTTVNSGPNDWNCIGNWAEQVVPGSSDDVAMTGNSAVKFGLVQSTLAGFSAITYSGAVGAPGQYLQIVPGAFRWAGTGVAYINIGSAAIAPFISQTGSATAPACGLNLLGSAMTGILNVEGGSVAIAALPGQTSTAATVQVLSPGRVLLGSGLTLTSFRLVGGNAEVQCAATNLEADSGTLATDGAGAITNVTVNSGSHIFNSTGTITNFHKNGGTSDFSQSDAARTITNYFDSGNGVIKIDPSVVTCTNTTLQGRSTVSSVPLTTNS